MSPFDWFLDACELCFLRVPHLEAGMALLLVAAILAVWAVTLIASVYQGRATDDGRRDWRYWRPALSGFPFLLGVFMAFDAAVYAVIALSTLARPRPMDLWAVVLVTALAASSVAAFIAWARARLPNGRA